jgi:hypothetical protein
MQSEIEKLKEKDLLYNRVSSSRFLFFMTVLSAVAFLLGASYELYEHRYEGKPKVEVQSSTLYTPQYK